MFMGIDEKLGESVTLIYERNDYYPLPIHYYSGFGLKCNYIHEDRYCTLMRNALNCKLSFININEV